MKDRARDPPRKEAKASDQAEDSILFAKRRRPSVRPIWRYVAAFMTSFLFISRTSRVRVRYPPVLCLFLRLSFHPYAYCIRIDRIYINDAMICSTEAFLRGSTCRHTGQALTYSLSLLSMDRSVDRTLSHTHTGRIPPATEAEHQVFDRPFAGSISSISSMTAPPVSTFHEIIDGPHDGIPSFPVINAGHKTE